jgi:hypothetical protein
MPRKFIADQGVDIVAPAKYDLKHLVAKIIRCAAVLVVLRWSKRNIS